MPKRKKVKKATGRRPVKATAANARFARGNFTVPSPDELTLNWKAAVAELAKLREIA